MPKKLVIVESPTKANTINRVLGKDYVVKASSGHVWDLPRSKEAIDVDNNFEPDYEIIKGKKKVINSLRSEAKKASEVILAADPDREGEAICWHLAQELQSTKKPIRRVTFNEITPNAVRAAMTEPREIDGDLVEAQQARRVLDRLVGYRISPLLWRGLRPGLSAGRVQSVAVRLICEREQEIRDFNPEEYWSVTATVETDAKAKFDARLYRIGEEKATFGTYGFGIGEARADEIVEDAKAQKFVVQSVNKRQQRQSPRAPFTTSTLQQEASRKLRFTARRTMQVAQSLYEGVEVGSETVGLITYMRTDSTRVSADAVKDVREFIEGTYGKEYKPAKARQYKSKKGAQDAHEAIRPTYVARSPESLKGNLTPDQAKLYDLIWKRFVASQMANAILDITTIDIEAGNYIFRATGSILRFPGFRTLYMESQDEEQESDERRQPLPDVAKGALLNLLGIEPKQHFTEPPPRYTEAILVRELEERGIGRPSTYAQIISTIQSRGYVEKDRARFIPTDVGELVTKMLISSFPNILDPHFTARMENELDDIEDGKRNWVAMMRDFYGPFTESLASASDKMYAERKRLEEVTDTECDVCGKPMAIKWGKYGKFMGCTGYPDCTNTQPMDGQKRAEPVSAGVKCPECGDGELLERRSRRGRVFFGCSSYPKCKFAVWDPPVPDEPCPQCGAPFLTHRKTKTRQYYLCYRRDECGYKTDPEPVTEDAAMAEGMDAGEGAGAEY